ncbi:MAG TPA: hypothetical protein VGO11_10205 [Chthoniobacteraceae bacterium]|nr:hypothetical protein [Chthoniobacteraceae bacterium]
MKPYRLLVDWEVIEQLNRFPVRIRRSLRNEFLRLKEFPDALGEFEERAEDGRLLNGFIRHGIAILYWIDFADRHVKVLGLTRAD